MESIASVNEAQQTSTPSPIADHAGGDGEDRISGLGDAVLLQILGLVADARDVVRTGALSRRWRGLWTRVPALRFDSWPAFESAGDVELYVAFVNNVLAQRTRWNESMELLAIPLIMDMDFVPGQEQLVLSSVKAAEGWIRYAARHGVTCFVLELRLPIRNKWKDYFNDEEKVEEDQEVDVVVSGDQDDSKEELEDQEAAVVNGDQDNSEEEVDDEDDIDDNDDAMEEEQSSEEGDDQETPAIDLDDLSSSANLETLRLDLHNVRVRLPSTVVFASLKYLALEFIKLESGSGHLLSRLLSSACCPHLQKLRMLYVNFKRAGTKQLVLENDALSKLSLENMEGMESLQLVAPNLLDLKIEGCSKKLGSVTVTAPELEELTFLHNPLQADVHGDFPCLWALKINLVSHMFYDDDINHNRICLLQRCSSTRGLLVHLEIPSIIERRVDVIKDKIPQLPHVTSLTVIVRLITERHSFGDGVGGLLTRFNNLRLLRLELDEWPGCKKADDFWSEDEDRDSLFFACDHEDHWEPGAMSFVHLQKAEFIGLTGTDCELRFLQSVLASAMDIQKVTISFSVNYSLEGRMDDFQQKLLAHGTWTAFHDDYKNSYKWRPNP